jgi:hypothetical protein
LCADFPADTAKLPFPPRQCLSQTLFQVPRYSLFESLGCRPTPLASFRPAIFISSLIDIYIQYRLRYWAIHLKRANSLREFVNPNIVGLMLESQEATAVATRFHQPVKVNFKDCWRALPLRIVALTISLVIVAGCGPQSDRLAVSGSVTLDGALLDVGSVRFTSLGEKPLSSGAMIRDGEYSIPEVHGLSPGQYHVEITSPDTKSPPVMARATSGGPGIPVQRERIPAEYNVNSKHSIEVTPDGDNEFDFDIVSRPAK